MSTFNKTSSNDTGDWQNNKEMNPAANSPETENGLIEDKSPGTADSWRKSPDEGDSSSAAAQQSADSSTTGDPGRTPGSAEGVEDFEKTGNE